MVTVSEISVTYADGVLRPDEKLSFPEGTRLRAVILPPVPDAEAAGKAMETIKRIRESGVFRSGGRKFTREEMHERG